MNWSPLRKPLSELMTNKTLTAFCFGLALMSLNSCTPSGSKPIVTAVIRGDLAQRVTISGLIRPHSRTVITAPYNGYVRKLMVTVGSKVKSGDAIVSVAQSLRGSTDEVFPLRAPLAGTVVQVLRTEGEYVEALANEGRNSLVRIDDLSRLYVEASAPEIEVVKMSVGQTGIIKAAAILDRTYNGAIKSIALASKDQNSWERSKVEFPIQIEVTDADAQLKPGMSVIVDIITRQTQGVLQLRHEFIQKEGDQYFVITESGEKKPIVIGMQNEEAFEIRSGVSEGERIRQTDFLSTVGSN